MNFHSRADVELYVGERLALVAEALARVSRSEDLFPDGLPAQLERTLSFSKAAAPGFLAQKPLTAQMICVAIDRERDRRIDGGFAFAGTRFQSRASDRENIMGAAQLAMAFMGEGGDPDALRWTDPDKDFVWITEDNSTVPMTPAAVVGLFQAGVAYKSALTFYARDLKDAVIASEDPASVDITTGWPG